MLLLNENDQESQFLDLHEANVDLLTLKPWRLDICHLSLLHSCHNFGEFRDGLHHRFELDHGNDSKWHER